MQKIWKIEGNIYFTDGTVINGTFVDSAQPFQISNSLFGVTEPVSFSGVWAQSNSNGPLDFHQIEFLTTTWGQVSVKTSACSTAYDAIFGGAEGLAAPSSPHRVLSLMPVRRNIEQSSVWQSVKKLKI